MPEQLTYRPAAIERAVAELRTLMDSLIALGSLLFGIFRRREKRLMLYPDIKKLYIYKPPNAYTLDILSNDRLWAPKPERFNDPFDCDIEYGKNFTEEDYLVAISQRHGNRDQWPSDIAEQVASELDADGKFTPEKRDQVDRVMQEFIEENKNSGVICMSEVCDSILMWSHYAQGHMGVCFEFIRAKDNVLGDTASCSPITYGWHYPELDLGLLSHEQGLVVEKAMRTKSLEWAYEKEWRLITDIGDRECPLPGPISRVILGIKIEDGFKSCIETLCKKRNIPCVQAQKAYRRYEIDIP